MSEKHYRKLVVNAINPKIFINGKRVAPCYNDYGKFQGARSAPASIAERCTCGLPKNQIHEKLGCRHYGNIRKLLEANLNLNGDEDSGRELTLFNSLESDMRILNTDFMINGKPSNICQFGVARIHIDTDVRNSYDQGTGGYAGYFAPYQVTIHELWHSMDFFIAKRNEKSGNISSLHKDNMLYKTILEDVKEHINRIKNDTNKYGYEIQRKIDDNKDNGWNEYDAARKIFYERRCNLELSNHHIPEIELTGSVRPFELVPLYDILYGENIVNGSYKKGILFTPSITTRRDHQYWDDETLPAEFFANVGCVSGVIDDRNHISLKLMKTYFHKSYQVYKDIIKYALKAVR